LAELDQLIAGLRATGIDHWLAGAEWTREWVRENGVDSVVEVRLRAYRSVLAAARGGS
jgi:hypothetical protein